ncbi:transposase [Pseudomonas mucidolens]|uniref:transposase n=1 Tax=Pseudomonas mucidolens TaxID=46679 RepID=UPI000A00B585
MGYELPRHWSQKKKLAMIRESLVPGQSVSIVARCHDIYANQLLLLRSRIKTAASLWSARAKP